MEIHFEIGNRCLLTCKHCSSSAADYVDIKQYTDDDMINFLNKWSCKKDAYLTGGEPLLYPEIDKLLLKLNVEVNAITLGLFTTGIVRVAGCADSISEEYAYRLSKNGLKRCYLSLYNSYPAEHDRMTQLPGSYELTKSSIIALHNAGVDVRLNVVVTSNNESENEISGLLKIAEEWKVSEIRLLKLIRHGRAEKYWDEIGVTEEQYRKVVIDTLKKRSKVNITASGVKDILPCRKHGNVNICPAGKQVLYITCKGEVYPCASVKNKEKYRIGYVYDKDIVEKVNIFGNWKADEKLC